MAIIQDNHHGRGLFGQLLPTLGSIAGMAAGGPVGAGIGSSLGGLASGQSVGDALQNGAMAGIGGSIGYDPSKTANMDFGQKLAYYGKGLFPSSAMNNANSSNVDPNILANLIRNAGGKWGSQ